MIVFLTALPLYAARIDIEERYGRDCVHFSVSRSGRGVLRDGDKIDNFRIIHEDFMRRHLDGLRFTEVIPLGPVNGRVLGECKVRARLNAKREAAR